MITLTIILVAMFLSWSLAPSVLVLLLFGQVVQKQLAYRPAINCMILALIYNMNTISRYLDYLILATGNRDRY